jgi:hypothetical protein
VNGAGERNSQAQNDVSGRPAWVIIRSMRSKPTLRGMGARKRTRSMA